MAIPDFQQLMLPILEFAADGNEHSLQETVGVLAGQFHLTDEERKHLLPSGIQSTFHNRVGWAKTYLTKAGLLEPTRRGRFRITDEGRAALAERPEAIDIEFLKRYPSFVEFRAARRTPPPPDDGNGGDEKTPVEMLEESYQSLRSELASDLLEQVQKCSPQFFERLVVDLLVTMGYGGTRLDAGKAIGGTGDEGIDGTIKEDRLGLDVVYIQAKRWKGPVGRPEIQKFAGALQGQRAKKGIFITTSSFSSDAREYVSRIDSKIILIDGEELADLMIDHDVGVSTIAKYDLKRVDMDYFSEDE